MLVQVSIVGHDDDNSNENNVKDQHHKHAKPGHKRELVLIKVLLTRRMSIIS